MQSQDEAYASLDEGWLRDPSEKEIESALAKKLCKKSFFNKSNPSSINADIILNHIHSHKHSLTLKKTVVKSTQ